MTKLGRKPTPAHLRLVNGTRRTTRHGSEEQLRDKLLVTKRTFSKLGDPPKMLVGIARDAWNEYIVQAWWLDKNMEPSAIAFCQLWAAFRRKPSAFRVGMHAQMRAYMAELGLTDERNRPDRDPEAKDEFFDN